MKVAFLLSRIEQSGVTTHTLDLAKGLVDMGHEVCLITGGKVPNATSRVDDFYKEFEDLGILIKEFKTPIGTILQRVYHSLTSVLKIITEIKEYDPDVIHCQSPYMTFLPWLMRTKFTTTLHILYLKRNFKFKNPTHLIAISKESYEFSKKTFGIKDKDITLIHHGVSERFSIPISREENQSLKERLGIEEHKLIIGFAGSISLRKGSDLLVAALKGLSDRTKNKIHFVFLGGVAGSDEHTWLQGMITEAEVGNLITYVPFEDPKPFYDIFDIFVLPSRMESFPLVTIEAMMSECCPIRSNTEGAYEQIDHGVNGLLFENENVQEFIEALEKLANDPALRKQLAENAKKKALSRFTIPEMTRKTLEVYEKIRIH
ncbi:glycosyltransferase family 4 protein [Flavobacteriaceae bacterium TP-CH-4]|uniref:Glycosyltransferase family 4 protein n=1 Tax=Pelagihabitans pacificus TaxID=2696054 RepID=A0A967E8A2_9FLAO|nr:glycosyltransferase family 4 protein [Pelagihabitans pacificus]NHF61069.1 glycosyltransferase family 4 protein [Pelagihabitans pacificus]